MSNDFQKSTFGSLCGNKLRFVALDTVKYSFVYLFLLVLYLTEFDSHLIRWYLL